MARRVAYTSISDHSDRLEIEAGLDAGTPLRELEQKHEVSRSTLARYKIKLDAAKAAALAAPLAPTAPVVPPAA
jgi:hypothetical protein